MLPASASLRGKAAVSPAERDFPSPVPEASGSDPPVCPTVLTIFVQKEEHEGICDGDENSTPQGNPRFEKKRKLKTMTTLSSHLVQHRKPRKARAWSHSGGKPRHSGRETAH